MAEICICSDVTENHTLVSLSTLLEVKKVLNLHLLENDVWLLRFQNPYLLVIKNELIRILDELLFKRTPIKETTKKIISNGNEIEFKKTTITNVSYRGESIKFDFKNSNDFKICVLIGLYDLVELTLNLDGILVLYNRIKIEKYAGVSVISLLRIKYCLSKDELLNELNPRTYYQDSAISKSALENNIAMLEKLGLLFFDKELSKYRLTGRGYIFW